MSEIYEKCQNSTQESSGSTGLSVCFGDFFSPMDKTSFIIGFIGGFFGQRSISRKSMVKIFRAMTALLFTLACYESYNAYHLVNSTHDQGGHFARSGYCPLDLSCLCAAFCSGFALYGLAYLLRLKQDLHNGNLLANEPLLIPDPLPEPALPG